MKTISYSKSKILQNEHASLYLRSNDVLLQ